MYFNLYIFWQNDLKVIPPAIPDRRPSRQGSSPMIQPRGIMGGEDFDPMDVECMRLINEYFYCVRIFPGQDPGHVYVGWVTTQFHLQDKTFDQSKDRKVLISRVDDQERVIERSLTTSIAIFFSQNTKQNFGYSTQCGPSQLLHVES